MSSFACTCIAFGGVTCSRGVQILLKIGTHKPGGTPAKQLTLEQCLMSDNLHDLSAFSICVLSFRLGIIMGNRYEIFSFLVL